MQLDNGGKLGLYFGNVIWVSGLLIDIIWRLVYIVIGNLYFVLLDVEECWI